MLEDKIALRPCVMALSVVMALGLTGCGGGAGLRPSTSSSGSSGDVTVNVADTKVLGGIPTGNQRLVKNGSGTLIISNDTEYTGGTLINQGTLQIGNGKDRGSIIGDVVDNGSLAFNRPDQIVFKGRISGSGKVIQEGERKPTLGNPIVTLTGSNTYTGGTIIKSGILIVAGTIVGDVEDHGVLIFEPIKDWSYDGTISGNGSVEVANANTVKITSHSTYTGGTTVSGGTLEIAPGGVPGTGPVTVKLGGVGESFSIDSGVVLRNHVVMDAGVMINAGIIKASDGATPVTSSSSGGFGFGKVVNRDGGIIEGRDFAINMGTPQHIVNTGSGSTISSSSGVAIQLAKGGSVTNQDQALIRGVKAAIKLGAIGDVTNGVGSVIETTTPGAYAIEGPVNLINDGTIIGNVGSIDAASSATLSYGSTIKGNLELGASSGTDFASLTLTGGAGSIGRYSDVVSGHTILSGALKKMGDGTWIIDNDELKGVTSILVDSGTLQVGDGGSVGSIGNGNVMLHDATLDFNRNDDVSFGGGIAYIIDSIVGRTESAKLVQEGTGTLTLTGNYIALTDLNIERGAVRIGDGAQGPTNLLINVNDEGMLIFGSDADVTMTGTISGSGSLTKSGAGVLNLSDTPGRDDLFTYTGGTYVQAGILQPSPVLPGDVFVSSGAVLRGYTAPQVVRHFPGVKGNLTNAGTVVVRNGAPIIGGNYVQSATGRLAVSLGSELQVSGSATLKGGTLEVTGADKDYVGDDHTFVLTAFNGVSGTFDKLVKDAGVVFTSTTINYDANSVWLDTTGLNITTAAAGGGVTYTPASMGSAQRVQGAFEQLDAQIASGSLSGTSDAFVQNAGAFQQSPNYRAAQASLESLSGQLHAASAGMTLQAIDATGRALSDRLEHLSMQPRQSHMWMSQLQQGGNMTRSGFASVDYQLNGWMVGRDMHLGAHTLAGFAFSQGQGTEQLDGRFDGNRSRHAAGMFYLGWLGQRWYAHGRVGMGHYHQDMNRRLLLGTSYQGVWTDYDGHYNVAYGESGLHFGVGSMQLTPFVDLEYDRVARNGFAEHGAGGFGLKADDQVLSRWQGGMGLKLARQWQFSGGRSISLDARAQWRQTLSANGTVFNASFVGLDAWRPLTGVGLSRQSTVFGLDLNARPSTNTRLKLGYEYLTGDRGRAAVASASFTLQF